MHPVLILTHNNLELTKKCVESVRRQTIDAGMMVIDNGSKDKTINWLEGRLDDTNLYWDAADHNAGVSAGWNAGLRHFFEEMSYDFVLVINNDTQLPPYFYAELLRCNVSFVTGYSTEDMREIGPLFHYERKPLVVAPDFSAFLIRREAWEKVGPFDERMKWYASDNDWAVRAHRAGVPLYRSNTPFYHERSSTLKKASPEERREIQLQADVDREVFKGKYGCYPWDAEYADLFKVQNLESLL